jgi:uroporphyrin-3 C-methyltransferase
MNSAPIAPAADPAARRVDEPAAVTPTPAAPASDSGQWLVPRSMAIAVVLFAVAAMLLSVLLWQKLSNIQEQLARQSADTGAQALEARGLARQAQDLSRETAARQAVSETKISEVALQRTQLDELMKSLSRSRDENLVVDIESAVLLAQQQSQLTGSLEPLLAALKSADQRVARAAQPRLNPLQRAMARDVDRLNAATVSDTPTLLVKMDELVRMADDLPVANAVGLSSAPAGASKATPSLTPASWWERGLLALRDEARRLVRVSRIEQPEAALLSPEQSFFLRENLKLKLLNARLGLLARQTESSRADLAAATQTVSKYFDRSSRKTQAALTLLQQVQAQMMNLELPRLDGTLAALATAAAGR